MLRSRRPVEPTLPLAMASMTSPAITRLVDVPMMVHMPPNMDAKLSGRYNCRAGNRLARERSRITGIIMATRGVLLRNADPKAMGGRIFS